jgi:hypothetical protein
LLCGYHNLRFRAYSGWLNRNLRLRRKSTARIAKQGDLGGVVSEKFLPDGKKFDQLEFNALRSHLRE